jgi:hypothetical protein
VEREILTTMNWFLTVFFCLQNPDYGTCESPMVQVHTIEHIQSEKDCKQIAIDMIHSGALKVLHYVCLEKDPSGTVPIMGVPDWATDVGDLIGR